MKETTINSVIGYAVGPNAGPKVCPKCSSEKYLHESKALNGMTLCLDCGYIGHSEKVKDGGR